jgi:predicted flap endonuclease-1-like 5' DNA nuclease
VIAADMPSSLLLVLIGLAVLAVVAWAFARSTRKAKVIADDSATPLARDVLAEGAAPAPRNQALIDAAPAAVTIPPAPAPAEPAPAPTPTLAPAGGADDLSRIKGVGPKLVALLGELGVTTFAQIAAWDDAEVERIDAQLGRFAGRITRDQWIAQAKLLAAGDENTFAAQFGNNG